MRAQALIFLEMLVKMGVSLTIHIPELPDIELPDIPPIQNFFKISSSHNLSTPTYKNLHHTAIIEKYYTTNTDSPKKYLVDILKMVTATNVKGGKKF